MVTFDEVLTTTDHGTFTIRAMHADDINASGKIMCNAFNTQNEGLGLPPEWPDVAFTTFLVGALFSNPGYIKVVAVDKATDAIIGINFLDVGDPITAPGPIAVASGVQNKGVGRALMDYVLRYSHEIGKHDIRLVQVSNNLKSFALYASQGFQFGETLTMLRGRVKEGADLARYQATYTVRPMIEADVDYCSRMHEQANMFPRTMDLLGAVHPASPHQPFVAIQDGRIVAYTTGFFLLGHTVAETPESFKALFSIVSQEVEGALVHLPARVYPELLAWALIEAKLTVVRQEILMFQGHYSPPRSTPLYLPGMAY